MTRNLRIAYSAATPRTAHHFETLACVRFRMLILACCASQEDYADRFGVPLRTVSRYVSGETSLPAFRLLQLEAYAGELGVVVAEQPRRAA